MYNFVNYFTLNSINNFTSNFTNNFTNYSNYNTTIKNSEDNNDLPIYIPIIIILSVFIFCGCIFTFLIHECSVEKCLCQGFDLEKIKFKIADICLPFCNSIIDSCILLPQNLNRYNNNNIYDNNIYDDTVVINIDILYKPEYNYEEKTLQFKNEQCSICLEVSDGEQITTECGHVFCKECIETHLQISNQCPICRQIITKLYNNTIN